LDEGDSSSFPSTNQNLEAIKPNCPCPDYSDVCPDESNAKRKAIRYIDEEPISSIYTAETENLNYLNLRADLRKISGNASVSPKNTYVSGYSIEKVTETTEKSSSSGRSELTKKNNDVKCDTCESFFSKGAGIKIHSRNCKAKKQTSELITN